MNQTLKEFINNLFMTIKETEEIKLIKRDLLTSSNDKYNALIESGLTNNEALGRVISEFGSLDEILEDIVVNNNFDFKSNINTVSYNEVKLEYDRQAKYYKKIAFGVAFHILIIGILALISESAIYNRDFILILVLFGGSILPVTIYIIFGLKISQELTIKKEGKVSDESAISYVKTQLGHTRNNFIAEISIGVGLIITALILLYLGTTRNSFQLSATISFGGAFLLIAIAVYGFIKVGTNKYYLDNLLMTNPKVSSKTNKLLEKINGAIFLIAVLIFLLLGFLRNMWHISWISFVVAGILSAIINVLFMKDK